MSILEIFFGPKRGSRSQEVQQEVEKKLTNYKLYQFKFCPFCIKVRRSLKKLNLPIEIRDVKAPNEYQMELVSGGGKLQVPCLRIKKSDGKIEWMYESSIINNYLEKNFPL